MNYVNNTTTTNNNDNNNNNSCLLIVQLRIQYLHGDADDAEVACVSILHNNALLLTITNHALQSPY